MPSLGAALAVVNYCPRVNYAPREHLYIVQAGNTKGGKYHCTVDLLFDWFGISCMRTDNFFLQNRQTQNSQTGGRCDTSLFSIPCSDSLVKNTCS